MTIATRSNTKTLLEWAKEVHENSVAHGWYENPTSLEEKLGLVFGEIAEAGESYRNNEPVVWKKTKLGLTLLPDHPEFETTEGKYEGEAIEMADVIIRLMDTVFYFELFKTNPPAFRIWEKTMVDIQNDTIKKIELEKADDRLHYGNPMESHFQLYRTFGYNLATSVELGVSAVFSHVIHYCTYRGWDLDNLIRLKHEYNKTRPHRHGGKVC